MCTVSLPKYLEVFEKNLSHHRSMHITTWAYIAPSRSLSPASFLDMTSSIFLIWIRAWRIAGTLKIDTDSCNVSQMILSLYVCINGPSGTQACSFKNVRGRYMALTHSVGLSVFGLCDQDLDTVLTRFCNITKLADL